MTPADHGYRQCVSCRVWRAPGTLDGDGGCLDLAACVRAEEEAAVARLKASGREIPVQTLRAYPKPGDFVPAGWVNAARDWHTDSCLTRQAEGEACNCRPWTEGAS